MADLTTAIARCRRLLDLDADPEAVDRALGRDPVLGPLITGAPGRRVPRTVDAAEFAIRAVLGQQVSTAAARTITAALVAVHGDPVDVPAGGLTHLFPTPEALVDAEPALPATRRRTLATVVDALASGRLDVGPGADRDRARAVLAGLAGVGPWTVEMVAMRALGDPDAFPATDLGVRRAAAALDLPTAPGALGDRAGAWRPWRAYAVQHLWATTDHPAEPMATASPTHHRSPPFPTTTRPHGAGGPPTVPDPSTTDARFTVIDSPVGPLTLVARAGRLTNLAMDGQTHAAPPPPGSRRDDDAFRDVVGQLDEYFAGRRAQVRRAARPGGHRFPAGSVGAAVQPSPTAGRSATASWPAGWAGRRRRVPSGRRTGTTRWR